MPRAISIANRRRAGSGTAGQKASATKELRNPIQVPRLFHIRRPPYPLQRALRHRRVDVDLHEGILPALLPRARQRCDVDPLLGDDVRHFRDHARAVAVEEQQRWRVAFEARLEAVDLEYFDDAAADRRAADLRLARLAVNLDAHRVRMDVAEVFF